MILVRSTPSADAQIDVALQWWLANRALNPGLLREELASAFQMLQVAPLSGKLCRGRSDVRRCLLPRSRYHLYYTMESETEILILALWHAQKRRGPPLRILSR